MCTHSKNVSQWINCMRLLDRNWRWSVYGTGLQPVNLGCLHQVGRLGGWLSTGRFELWQNDWSNLLRLCSKVELITAPPYGQIQHCNRLPQKVIRGINKAALHVQRHHRGYTVRAETCQGPVMAQPWIGQQFKMAATVGGHGFFCCKCWFSFQQILFPECSIKGESL